MRYGVRKKKELALWGILCVGLILLYLLSSTDWIIKEKEVEVYPVSLIISDTSDDDYVNFRKGVDQAAVEYNVDVSFITLYEKDNLAQQMELVRREAADGAGVVILEPVDELECRQYLEENTYGTPIILLGELSPDEEVKGAVHMDWTAAGRKLGEAITAEQSPDLPVWIFADNPYIGKAGEMKQGLTEVLEKQGFYDTCVSMKSSTVPTMVAAARLFRAKCDYPLHIGVTETGPVRQGLIKSAMGIGALLLDGIGDTIRVSLTDDPVQEVYAARDILKAAGLRRDGVNIVSCPTCGRTRIDLIGLVNRVDEALKNCEKPITVAVMGCVVNGPGEAREADIGIAGGDGWGMIFEKGVQVEKLPYDELLPALLKRIEAL